MTNIAQNLKKIHSDIQSCCHKQQRDIDSVQLLAVSKGHSITKIKEANVAGQQHFGENYVQDALVKINASKDEGLNITWHFIGQLQSNKAQAIAKNFDWCHSLASIKHAKLLNRHRGDSEHSKPLQVCLQVQSNYNKNRGGILLSETSDFLETLTEKGAFEHLLIRGLMFIPTPEQNTDDLEKAYSTVKNHFTILQERFHNNDNSNDSIKLDTLSMGMSGDFQQAIAHGSTMVRIGTAVFGPRNYSQ